MVWPLGVGLGIWDLVCLTGALLGMWLWRFSVEKESMWRMVLVSKYGSGGGAGVHGRLGVHMQLGFEHL